MSQDKSYTERTGLPDRRKGGDRRTGEDRRSNVERRQDFRDRPNGKRRSFRIWLRSIFKARMGVDRRKGGDRRRGGDRRQSMSAAILTKEEINDLLS